MCEPGPVGSFHGDVHGRNGPPSSEHSNVDPGSEALNTNGGPPPSTDVSGGGSSS